MGVKFIGIFYLAPELPPENVRLVNATPTVITIEWDPVPCLQQNALITSYAVEVRPGGGGELVSSGEVESDSSLIFRATNLRGTSFSFRVYPVTSEFGRSDKFSSFTAETLPGTSIV